MSNESGDPRPIDDRLFDRLVDGELDAGERRSLLATLDETPMGWRRCALAFLEAQAWRSDLSGAAARPAEAERAADRAAIGRSSSRSRLRRATAIVAAVLLSFAAGWLLRTEPRRSGQQAGPPSFPVTAVRESAGDTAEASGTEREGAGPAVPAAVRVAGVYKFEIDDHGQPRTVAVPVLEGPGIDTRWLLAQPPAIRASVVQALERRGHKVEAHRQLLSVNLKDGRKLILPVDEVDVRSANRVYQ